MIASTLFSKVRLRPLSNHVIEWLFLNEHMHALNSAFHILRPHLCVSFLTIISMQSLSTSRKGAARATCFVTGQAP